MCTTLNIMCVVHYKVNPLAPLPSHAHRSPFSFKQTLLTHTQTHTHSHTHKHTHTNTHTNTHTTHTHTHAHTHSSSAAAWLSSQSLSCPPRALPNAPCLRRQVRKQRGPHTAARGPEIGRPHWVSSGQAQKPQQQQQQQQQLAQILAQVVTLMLIQTPGLSRLPLLFQNWHLEGNRCWVGSLGGLSIRASVIRCSNSARTVIIISSSSSSNSSMWAANRGWTTRRL